jgi:predicted dehydrogenase
MDSRASGSEPTRRPIGVGFIGSGSVLWAYLQLLDRLVARGLAREGPICARRPETWPNILSRRPKAQLVIHPEQVMESEVEVIVVITPPSSHAEFAMLALQAGKHVLIEKPMAASRTEAEEVLAVARHADRRAMAAPFVQLAPTIRALWSAVRAGDIGQVHSARAMYGNPGSTWATWYHDSGVGPLGDLAVYNLKTLTSLLGPVTEVFAADTVAVAPRIIGETRIEAPEPDSIHMVLRHRSGALSSVLASHAIQAYRRPAIELYGTEGTANLSGDDWAPRGIEMWQNSTGYWKLTEPVDETWLWTDGLRELVVSIGEHRGPLHSLDQDLHLLDVLGAAEDSARNARPVAVSSDFADLDLTLEVAGPAHIHDRTRPPDEQT